MLAKRITEAKNIIRNCIGKNGVWASPYRYKNQCWTRDFCLAISPLFLFDSELKNIDLVKTHLLELAKRQRSDGKIPILYLDDEKQFLRDKINKSIVSKSISFMLERYLENGLEDLTPHTRDSEVLFVMAVDKLLRMRHNFSKKEKSDLIEASHLAMAYTKSILKNELIPGADWRDTRLDLDDKNVLTNACFLYNAYYLVGETENANSVKKIIQKEYWNGKYFIDYLGSENFDILGNSLAIIYNIATTEQMNSIFTYAMQNLDTPYGFKMTDTFLPALTDNEKEIMERDRAVIWPFTNGFLLMAMVLKGGKEWVDVAKIKFSAWVEQNGFNEWYDITNGVGYGSEDQVWSAALFLRVHKLIEVC